MAIHLTGKLGKNGPPWPWATLAVNLEPNANPVDLTHVKGIRFKAKGTASLQGRHHAQAVTDYGTLPTPFRPAKTGSSIRWPLSKLKANPIGPSRSSRAGPTRPRCQFQPTIGEATFDLWVDDVEFVFETGKPITFKKP